MAAADDADDVTAASQHPCHSSTAIFPASRTTDGQTDGGPLKHPAPFLSLIHPAMTPPPPASQHSLD
ncbi:hypothetical protein CesoFtcFv8_015070 [Champsocephalus esox]|uniref:Uncharacterized protein n=1 Tax=Champsocephalus esox TaxID=159716 RepID=A0AAN8BPD2_9TELE|nr:hypothetical protein CesoFtcFv8_015070 [Champsocephalus esox]